MSRPVESETVPSVTTDLAGGEFERRSSPIIDQFQIGSEAVDTLRLLVRKRRTIVLLTLLAAVVSGGVSLWLPKQFKSRVLLLPATEGDLNSMGFGAAAGIASTLGVDLGAPSLSVAYPDIIESRQVRERILESSFEATRGEARSLEAIIVPRETVPHSKRTKALSWLERNVSVESNRESGVLKLTVTAPDPVLAQELASRYVEEVERVETDLRVENARTNRKFLDKRVAGAERELQEKEEALKSFRELNPHLGRDAELQLSAWRLERGVRVQEEIYLTLVRQWELAKIEESRKTAGVQVIDPATVPLHPSSPVLLKNILMSAFLASIGSSLLVIAESYLAAIRDRLNLDDGRRRRRGDAKAW